MNMDPRKNKKLNESTGNILQKMTIKNVYSSPQLMKESTKITNPPVVKKKKLPVIVKNEYKHISDLFDLLDIHGLNRDRRNMHGEDDEEDMHILNIPEKKIFQKGSKKGSSQATVKSKSFPQTIDGLEKELSELRGSSMTYQKKLRMKGLNVRLVKKKKRENIKQQQALLKQGKTASATVNGPKKLIKPVLNSDGNVVSNKFDFANSESKRDNKRKLVSQSEIQTSQEKNKILMKENSNFNETGIKNENCGHLPKNAAKKVKIENGVDSVKTQVNDNQSSSLPIFNKENKMVFSKIFVSENNRKHKKKKEEKDPQKVLQKLKENSKKISELGNEDKAKAVSLIEKQKWTAALKRASGETVRDDPELLKKSIAKEKNQKMRSKKKWEARTDRVQKEKDDRQKKRTANIKAKKDDKKQKKLKKAIKKGSYVKV